MDQENSSRMAVITDSGTDGFTVVLVGRTEATLRQTVQGPDGLFTARVLCDHSHSRPGRVGSRRLSNDAQGETMTQVERLLGSSVTDTALMVELTELINRVYKVAEDGLWKDGAARTDLAEVTELTRAGEIVVARQDGRVVGCVRVQHLDAETGEFGMLAADPERRDRGIGRDLVRFAEQSCADAGLRTMQLELLVPREWTHPFKEFLAGWYTRIGYRAVRRGTIEEAYPHLAPQLGTPCDFVIYHKPLSEP